MPGLVGVFQTDYATVQLALTLYLVAVGVAQAVVEPQFAPLVQGLDRLLVGGPVLGMQQAAAEAALGHEELGGKAQQALDVGADEAQRALVLQRGEIEDGGRLQDGEVQQAAGMGGGRGHGRALRRCGTASLPCRCFRRTAEAAGPCFNCFSGR